MSDYIPREVLIDILTKLPVKTLLRCTSVCKSWYSLITSPSFITTHLNLNNNNNTQILVRNFIGNDSFSGTEHYSVHTDNKETFDNLATLDFPFTCIGGYFRVIGSCNGLVCLSDDEFGYKQIMYLWNPSIRKFLTIPSPSVTFQSHGPFSHSIGFGFDASTNDYKIVRVVDLHSYPTRVPPEVELYELSTGAWRSINAGNFKYVVNERAPQAFLNGVVHWTGSKDGFPRLIVSFNMKNEELGAMMVPPSLQRVWDLRVAVCRDSLSLIHSDYDNYCSVWVMEEYGTPKSWTKQFTVDLKNGYLKTPFGFRENGDILLLARNFGYQSGIRDLVSYDPKSKQIKNLGVRGHPEAFYKDTYLESLVLLEGLSEVLGRKENSCDAVACEGASFSPKEDDEGQGNKRNEKTTTKGESNEPAGLVARLDNQIEEAKCQERFKEQL